MSLISCIYIPIFFIIIQSHGVRQDGRRFSPIFSSNFQRSFTTRKPVSAKFYDDFFSSSQNRFGRRFYVLLLLHHAGWHPPANRLAPTFIKIDFIDFKKLFETDSDIVRGEYIA